MRKCPELHIKHTFFKFIHFSKHNFFLKIGLAMAFDTLIKHSFFINELHAYHN